MSALAAGIAKLLFPRRCPVCDKIIQPVGLLICPGCRSKLSYTEATCCKKCGKSIENAQLEYCYGCSRHKRTFYSGIALLDYNSLAKKIIADFKYHNKRENADFLVDEAWRLYKKELCCMGADALVPVPLHARKKRLRGFNQAEELALRLGEKMSLPVYKHGLIRKKNTKPQKELGYKERLNNVITAFEFGNIPREIKSVILVDDIYTTGSTAEACSRVLIKAGIERVYLLNMCIGRNI
jgi:ComF family protein